MRFCRSVGYDGLADFKLKLAGVVNEGVPFVHRAVDEDDRAAELIRGAPPETTAIAAVAVVSSLLLYALSEDARR